MKNTICEDCFGNTFKIYNQQTGCLECSECGQLLSLNIRTDTVGAIISLMLLEGKEINTVGFVSKLKEIYSIT